MIWVVQTRIRILFFYSSRIPAPDPGSGSAILHNINEENVVVLLLLLLLLLLFRGASLQTVVVQSCLPPNCFCCSEVPPSQLTRYGREEVLHHALRPLLSAEEVKVCLFFLVFTSVFEYYLYCLFPGWFGLSPDVSVKHQAVLSCMGSVRPTAAYNSPVQQQPVLC
jgi:hypothetical protein